MFSRLSLALRDERNKFLMDLSHRATGLEFVDNEHGWASLTCFVRLSLAQSYSIYNHHGLLYAEVGWMGNKLWEGRVEDVALAEGGVRLTAVGFIRFFDDIRYSVAHIGETAYTIIDALILATTVQPGSNAYSIPVVQWPAYVLDPGVTLAEIYKDRSGLDILNRLASLGDDQTPPNLVSPSIRESRTLVFQARDFQEMHWYADVLRPDIARTLDTLINSVYVVHQDGGNARTVTATAEDRASQSRFGVRRTAAIHLQTQDATLAGQVRDSFLSDQATPPSRAAIPIEAIYDARGGRWPLWVPRSGDTLTLRNLPPSLGPDVDRIRTFRIKERRYRADPPGIVIIPDVLRPGVRPTEAIERLESVTDPDFEYSPRPTIAELYSELHGLPGLRALYYASNVDASGALLDQSGAGRTLSLNGNPQVGVHNDFIPYFAYDGAGDYHSRGDEAGLDITGTEAVIGTALRGLTIIIIARFNALATGVNLNPLLAKWVFSASNNRSYTLDYNPALGGMRFGVSSNGTAVTNLVGPVPAIGKWYFFAARFQPSTEMALWHASPTGLIKLTNTTSIPASIFNSNAALMQATFDAAASANNILNGDIALTVLCASAVRGPQVEHIFDRLRRFYGM